MTAKRIKELRKVLAEERISYGELHEIDCAADDDGIEIKTEEGMMAGDILDALEEKLISQKK
jgi:hypothetical protein